MKKNNAPYKDTAILATGEIIASLLTVIGFFIASFFTEVNLLSVALGATLGSVITVLNYFFLSLSVIRSVDKYLELRGNSEMTDEEAAVFTAKHSMQIQNAVKTSFLIRIITMLAALIAAFLLLNIFNPIATAIPLLAYRPILSLSEGIRRKFDKTPNPENFIVYDEETTEKESDE